MSLMDFDDFVAVPISTELYMSIAKRFPGSVSSIIEHSVESFLERTEGEVLPIEKFSNGFSWGPVFLPSGTKLRVKYKNEYKYAEIEEDEILYEGNVLPSVSRMASLMCNGTNVNAWINVEVQRPVDKTWILADVLRRS